jgi:hypothetical protein
VFERRFIELLARRLLSSRFFLLLFPFFRRDQIHRSTDGFDARFGDSCDGCHGQISNGDDGTALK